MRLRRRYGRAKSSTAWVMGRAPSHRELFSSGKPLSISKFGSGWKVEVLGAPVVKGAKGLSFRGRVGFEEGSPTMRFDTKGDAQSIALQIGNYMLGLGQFVSTYTEGY